MAEKIGKINLLKIKDEIDILEKELKNTNSNNRKKETILDTLQLYYLLVENITGQKINYEKKFSKYNSNIDRLCKKYSNEYRHFVEYIKSNKLILRKICESINNIYYDNDLYENDYEISETTVDTILSLVDDIFDSDFTNFFYKEIKDKKIHFNTSSNPNGIISGYDGITIDIYPNKNYYVIAKDKKTYYYNLFTIIHEISHGYINSKYNKNFTYNPLREIFPCLNELIVNDYFFTNNLAVKDCKIQDNYLIREIINDTNKLYYWTYFINAIDQNLIIDGVKFNKIIEKEKFHEEVSLDSITSSIEYFEILLYSLGRVISIDQYNRYLNNPDRVRYNIDKLLKEDNHISFMSQLKMLEIDIDELRYGKCFESFFNNYHKKYVKK